MQILYIVLNIWLKQPFYLQGIVYWFMEVLVATRFEIIVMQKKCTYFSLQRQLYANFVHIPSAHLVKVVVSKLANPISSFYVCVCGDKEALKAF